MTYLICTFISVFVAVILYLIIQNKTVNVEIINTETIDLPTWFVGRIKIVKCKIRKLNGEETVERIIKYQVKRQDVHNGFYWKTEWKLKVDLYG